MRERKFFSGEFGRAARMLNRTVVRQGAIVFEATRATRSKTERIPRPIPSPKWKTLPECCLGLEA